MKILSTIGLALIATPTLFVLTIGILNFLWFGVFFIG